MYYRPDEKQYKEFKEIFGVSLGDYIHPIFGFDLFAFEDKFFPENMDLDISLAEQVNEKYGEKAEKLIWSLLGVNEK